MNDTIEKRKILPVSRRNENSEYHINSSKLI
jgi:hypothetical protein